ncbi:MAG: response regulator [Desulfobulbus sp.]|nr:response regulator [Desulfobulbus sp.]
MRPGLSKKILFPTLAIIAIGLMALLVMEHFNARAIVRQELSKRLDREVALSAKLIDSWLQARLIDIVAWSRQDVLSEALTEGGYYGRSARQGATELLANLKGGYQQYESIFLTNTQGEIIAIAPQTDHFTPSVRLTDRPYFQKALSGKSVISDVIISRFSAHKTFTVAAPITIQGAVIGVLGGVIDFSVFNTLFLQDFKVKQFGYAFLIDSDRQILGSSRNNEELLSDPNYAEVLHQIATKPNGRFPHEESSGTMLTVFQHLQRTDWTFVIDQAIDETLQPLSRIFRVNTAGAVLILLILSTIIVFLFRQLIVHRLQDMLRVTMTVSQGDLSQRIERPKGSADEITELTDSFNSMIVQLGKTVSALNEEIRVRTKTEATLAHHQENLEKIIEQRSVELKKEIGERQKAEERLVRAEKLEMIGTLAGGVAHDLNNILSGIVSYPDLLLMKLPPDSPLYPPLRTIKESGEKAAAIVQDLLTLARRGVTVREVVDLNKQVTAYLASPEFHLLQSHHPQIRVYTDCAPDLFNILGSPVHLAKSIMNLVTNAAESMEQGGEIQIRTENRYVDSSLRLYEKIGQGEYVVLEVKDQGCGISQEDLEKIFEPFFTSKRMGKSGTGLGMAVVWGTVKDHKGYIDCESTLGIGTTFTLYFPVTSQSHSLQLQETHLEEYLGQGEHILVVDDIAEQRQIASTILTELGYQVSTADSGEEAVRMASEQKFDLLLLDMILGEGMDGLDIYRRIIVFAPGQPAIITSGFSSTDRIAEAIQLGVGQYLKKPYMINKLGQAIRDELNAATPRV